MAKNATKKITARKRSDGRPLQQYAALPYICNPDGTLEVLVMSSRETRRAVIPKGWPMKNRKSWKAAEIEARQEAGVLGVVGRRRLGQYRYWKRLERSFALVKVSVFPLRVTRHLTDWREKHERVLFWMNPEDAATLVDEPELGELIRDFAAALDGKGKKPAGKKAVAKKAVAKKPKAATGAKAADRSKAGTKNDVGSKEDAGSKKEIGSKKDVGGKNDVGTGKAREKKDVGGKGRKPAGRRSGDVAVAA